MSERTRLILATAAVAAVGAVVAAIVLASGGSEESTPPPGKIPRSNFHGANAPLLRAYTTPDLVDSLEAESRSMAEEGLGWARTVFGQVVEQPFPGAIDWSIPDAVVATLAREGIRTEPLFLGTPAWVAAPEFAAGCGQFAYPNDVQASARFMGDAARRYGSEGGFWKRNPEIPRLPIRTFEVGNEPNLGAFWCPAANPEQYAAVYRASREAVLAADPKASVIVGGLAPTFGPPPPGDLTVPDFLRRLVAADPALARQIPAVAIHPYAETPSDVLQVVRLYREAMRAAGLGERPMIINEVGWYTSGPPSHRQASESDRAGRIAELTAVIDETDCGIAGFGIHAWFTREQDSADPEDWYGVADPAEGDPRESAIAYGAAIGGDNPEQADALRAEAATLCGRP